MQGFYDYKKFAILYVDDEEKSLKYFARAFEDQFRILTAVNAVEGLALLEKHQDEIAVLMTDQRMPGEKGTWLLEKARQLRPRIIRILTRHHTQRNRRIGHIARNRPRIIQQPIQRSNPCNTHQPARRKYAHYRTCRRRHPD